jgi:hypothetical protein
LSQLVSELFSSCLSWIAQQRKEIGGDLATPSASATNSPTNRLQCSRKEKEEEEEEEEEEEKEAAAEERGQSWRNEQTALWTLERENLLESAGCCQGWLNYLIAARDKTRST